MTDSSYWTTKISGRFLASQIMYINIKGSHKVEPFLVREGFKITKFWIDNIRILSFTFAKINPVLNALITSPYFLIYHWIFFVELSLMTVRAGYDNNSNTIPPARENMMTSFWSVFPISSFANRTNFFWKSSLATHNYLIFRMCKVLLNYIIKVFHSTMTLCTLDFILRLAV